MYDRRSHGRRSHVLDQNQSALASKVCHINCQHRRSKWFWCTCIQDLTFCRFYNKFALLSYNLQLAEKVKIYSDVPTNRKSNPGCNWPCMVPVYRQFSKIDIIDVISRRRRKTKMLQLTFTVDGTRIEPKSLKLTVQWRKTIKSLMWVWSGIDQRL